MNTYVQGSDLPDLAIDWYDSVGELLDFSSGWTFVVRVGKAAKAAEFEKTSGVVGAASSPNLTIVWDDGELDSLDPGIWTVQVTASRTADDKERKMKTAISVIAGVDAVVTP